MDINRGIMIVFAIGALVGGIDFLLGNKYGYGEQFEEGINLLAPTAFNMVGIICLTPSIAVVLRTVLAPVCHRIGIDPGIIGGVLALDMGGYPLAMELAENPELGLYSGILCGCILGCTLVFAIPFGMGVCKKDTQDDFLKGVIVGLIAMPAGLLTGGLVQGISLTVLLFQSLPLLIFSGFLILGLWRIPEKMLVFFRTFVRGLKFVIRFGLVLATVLYLLGIETPYVTPITEAMTIVVNICLVLIGSLPFAKLLQVLLKKPLEQLGKVLKIQSNACAGLMISLVSSVPVMIMLDDMNPRDRVIVTAFLIDTAAILGAHLAYTAANAPGMTLPLIVCKLTAGVIGVLLAACLVQDPAKKEQL